MQTQDRQISKLIDVLSRRPDRAFEQFVHALVHTRQDDLAILLDPNTAYHFIETRDAQQPPPPAGTVYLPGLIEQLLIQQLDGID